MSLILEVIIVGLILSADSFSAAVAMGLRPFTRKDALKFAASSGGAEAVVALFGALAGTHIISRFASIDHWIAFILLMGVALHMGYEGLGEFFNWNKEHEEEVENSKKSDVKFHSFTKIIIVSLATSLDAFGVGVSLGVAHRPIFPFVISIGFWAFVTTIIGLNLAKKLSSKFGPLVHLFGAIVLGIMAFQMLKI